jgi:hypothetical protein
MNKTDSHSLTGDKSPNFKLAATCGLYCGSCGIYLATQENDVKKMLGYALILNQSFDETLCDGCRAERKSAHCKTICTFIKCASEKGIEFCGDCNDYPCNDLKVFQSKMPHRIEIWESQQRIKEVGREKWLIEMNEHFSCPACQTVNSAYDLTCRNCGNSPGCQFVFLHREKIEEYLSK